MQTRQGQRIRTNKRDVAQHFSVHERAQVGDQSALGNVQLELLVAEAELLEVVQAVAAVVSAEDDEVGVVYAADVAKPLSRRLSVELNLLPSVRVCIENATRRSQYVIKSKLELSVHDSHQPTQVKLVEVVDGSAGASPEDIHRVRVDDGNVAVTRNRRGPFGRQGRPRPQV